VPSPPNNNKMEEVLCKEEDQDLDKDTDAQDHLGTENEDNFLLDIVMEDKEDFLILGEEVAFFVVITTVI
jgi:hypothetical protein